jgi:hypothetical protein
MSGIPRGTEVDTVHLDWWGPFSFYEMNIPGELLDGQGVYVLAYKYQGRYFAYYVGETGGSNVGRHKTFLNRLVEHRYGFMTASYWRYDPVQAASSGRLPEGEKPPGASGSPASGDGEVCFDRLGTAWVKALSVFLAPIPGERRDRLETIESAICHHLRRDPKSDFARFHERHHVNGLTAPLVLVSSFGEGALEGFEEPVDCQP